MRKLFLRLIDDPLLQARVFLVEALSAYSLIVQSGLLYLLV